MGLIDRAAVGVGRVAVGFFILFAFLVLWTIFWGVSTLLIEQYVTLPAVSVLDIPARVFDVNVFATFILASLSTLITTGPVLSTMFSRAEDLKEEEVEQDPVEREAVGQEPIGKETVEQGTVEQNTVEQDNIREGTRQGNTEETVGQETAEQENVGRHPEGEDAPELESNEEEDTE